MSDETSIPYQTGQPGMRAHRRYTRINRSSAKLKFIIRVHSPESSQAFRPKLKNYLRMKTTGFLATLEMTRLIGILGKILGGRRLRPCPPKIEKLTFCPSENRKQSRTRISPNIRFCGPIIKFAFFQGSNSGTGKKKYHYCPIK